MTETKNKCGFNGPLPKTTTDDELYDYFIKNIYYIDLKINGMNIKVFTTPFEDNRMQGFFHLTTKTQKKIRNENKNERISCLFYKLYCSYDKKLFKMP